MLRQLPALCAGVLMLAACTNGEGQSGVYLDPAPSTGPTVVLDELETFKTMVGDTVHFDTDAYALSDEAQATLQRQGHWLQVYPRYSLMIEGHADERGTREYNLALGERRAQALRDYLIALGVDPKRLKTISYGKERPICTEAEETCWSRNRRGVSTLEV